MKKRVTLSLFAMMLSVVLAACGSSKSESYDSAAEPAALAEWAVTEEAAEEALMDSYYSEEAKMAEGGAEAGENAPEVDESAATSQRKLIKTVDLSVETKEYDTFMVSLEKQITELGGYIENLSAYNGSYYDGWDNRRSANITARVPVDKLDGFLKQVGEEANVVDRTESVEDITLQYVDLDSHARMLEEEQERLLELLSNAETIEDIIAIESRLSEVKYQLESMKSQLRTYDNKVQYSTVHIYIDEVVELTPVVELSAGERIATGFANSVRDIAEGIKEFCIEFVIHIPYIIVWAVVIAVMAFIVIKIIKAADKRTARLRENAKNTVITQGSQKSVFVKRPGSPSIDRTEDKESQEENKTE